MLAKKNEKKLQGLQEQAQKEAEKMIEENPKMVAEVEKKAKEFLEND